MRSGDAAPQGQELQAIQRGTWRLQPDWKRGKIFNELGDLPNGNSPAPASDEEGIGNLERPVRGYSHLFASLNPVKQGFEATHQTLWPS